MAVFPALEPNTRSYNFGLFPITEEPSISAGIVRFRHSNTAQNYTLTLGYVGLTDAQASLIRTHFQQQGGSYLSFQVPPVIWKGHTFTGNIAAYNSSWRYLEAPEEEHYSIGYVNVTVTLGSDGSLDPEMGQVTPTITTNGAGGGGSGLTSIVTVGLSAGAATV